MLKSLFRCLSVSTLIIGTVIGAGFASGREVTAFFGDAPDVWTALLCSALVFLCSALFLFVGRGVQKDDIGEVNGVVFGRLRAVADIFLLFNSMTVLGAMLAGTDSLFSEYIDIRPFGSVVVGIVCAAVAVRGLSGLLRANAVLVPIMAVFLAVCAAGAIELPLPPSGGVRFASVALYVSMNMILGGGVLTTVHRLSPREIVFASAVAAVAIGGLLSLIMAALPGAATADMPMLLIALKSGRTMYLLAMPVIAVSIFTTMLSAFKSVYDYLFAIIGNRWVAAGAVLLGGLAVGAFGFSGVVDRVYPAVGVVGLLYIAFNIAYLFKSRRLSRYGTSFLSASPRPPRQGT